MSYQSKCVYGFASDASSLQIRPDIDEIIIKNLTPSLKKQFDKFVTENFNATCELKEKLDNFIANTCEEITDNERDDIKNIIGTFIDDYESETGLYDGWEGLMVDIINEREFNNQVIFNYDNCTVFVEPYIPVDSEEKALLPTQTDIQKIVSKYFGQLTNEPITVKWLTIST